MSIKPLIEREILGDDDKVRGKFTRLQYLFKAFPNNREILNEIESYSETLNTSKNTNKRKYISSLLKSNWYSYWLNMPIIQDDKLVIEKYFNSYTSLQQKKLTDKIKKELKEDFLSGKSNISLKQIPELTLALKEYRKNDISYLKNYIDKRVSLSEADSERIINAFYNEYNFNSQKTKLMNDFLLKSKGICWIDTNNVRILGQENRFFSELMNTINQITTRNFNKKDKDDRLMRNLEIVGIDTQSKFDFTVSLAQMICNSDDSKVESYFNNSITNIDQTIKDSNVLSNFIKVKFNMSNEGIDTVIKILEDKKNQEKIHSTMSIEINPEEFNFLIQKVKKISLKNKLLENLDESQKIIKKVKI